MRTLLLVHGAASGPWVFDGWGASFPDAEIVTVDLQAGLDLAEASMSNYEAAVAAAAWLLERPLALCGWSLGGLAAMMAARRVAPEALVLLEPSPPAEVQGIDESVVPGPGTFDGEETYGRFPPGVRARPESALARAERKRGISVPSLSEPTLVVYGDEFAEERGRSVARRYGAEELPLPGLDHWRLVLDPACRTAVAGWLRRLAE
ncbi:MAG: alpha/beta fold hydrolase [Gaiellaceae bacterium]